MHCNACKKDNSGELWTCLVFSFPSPTYPAFGRWAPIMISPHMMPYTSQRQSAREMLTPGAGGRRPPRCQSDNFSWFPSKCPLPTTTFGESEKEKLKARGLFRYLTVKWEARGERAGWRKHCDLEPQDCRTVYSAANSPFLPTSPPTTSSFIFFVAFPHFLNILFEFEE